MKKAKLCPLSVGEISVGGYCGRMIEYVKNKQLLDAETWAVLVNQFRLQRDGINGGWRGEYWGKMMRGAALTYRVTGSAELYSVLADTVEDLLSTEEASGRISSYPEGKELFAWDVWGRKYVLLGLIYFLEVCPDEALRERIVASLVRQADYIIERFGEGKRSLLEGAGHVGGMNSASILEPIVKLYSLTGEERYLDFARYIISTGMCERVNIVEAFLGGERYPYQLEETKAYEMISCFEGLLEYHKVTGDPESLLAVRTFLARVLESDYTIIGASGCTHEYFDNSTIRQTEPPAREVMQETCVTVTLMKLLAKMLALTGEARYAEYIERSALNAMYGAVNSTGQTMCRTPARTWVEGGRMLVVEKHEAFPFDSYSPLYRDRRGIRVGGFQLLEGGRSYGCCVCIGSAGTAISGLYTVMKGQDGLYVNTYNDCRAKTEVCGSRFSLEMSADPYRCDGAVIVADSGGARVTLALRVPSWAELMRITINGERVEHDFRDGYARLERVFSGDRIELTFKTPVKMRVLNGKIAFVRGPVALARDARLGDHTAAVKIDPVDGAIVDAVEVENTTFPSNVAYRISTEDGDIILSDYAEAGKNFDEESSGLSVWLDAAK